jgi:hypothetical protein
VVVVVVLVVGVGVISTVRGVSRARGVHCVTTRRVGVLGDVVVVVVDACGMHKVPIGDAADVAAGKIEGNVGVLGEGCGAVCSGVVGVCVPAVPTGVAAADIKGEGGVGVVGKGHGIACPGVPGAGVGVPAEFPEAAVAVEEEGQSGFRTVMGCAKTKPGNSNGGVSSSDCSVGSSPDCGLSSPNASTSSEAVRTGAAADPLYVACWVGRLFPTALCEPLNGSSEMGFYRK